VRSAGVCGRVNGSGRVGEVPPKGAWAFPGERPGSDCACGTSGPNIDFWGTPFIGLGLEEGNGLVKDACDMCVVAGGRLSGFRGPECPSL
jgi:hypothetical protein